MSNEDTTTIPPPFSRLEAVAAVVLAVGIVAVAIWLGVRAGTMQPITIEEAQTRPAAYHLLLNVNTATAAELMMVPGIGATRARSIVRDREVNGVFPSVAALDRVSGIGPVSIRNWRPFLVANDAERPAVTVDTPPEPAQEATDSPATDEPVYPLDLNRATLEALTTLPEMGPVTAQAILDDREANGPFLAVEHLLRVGHGISLRKVELWRQYLTVIDSPLAPSDPPPESE